MPSEQESESVLRLRETPLRDRHEALGARLVPFAGWLMPVQYSGILNEHRAVRTAAVRTQLASVPLPR